MGTLTNTNTNETATATIVLGDECWRRNRDPTTTVKDIERDQT
jgi:hypothetical protein